MSVIRSFAKTMACLLAAGGTSALLLVAPAQASCVAAQPVGVAVHGAAAAFVGVVTATDSSGRRATVTVEDVWRGAVPSPAHVVGTPSAGTALTTVDRHYLVGTRYLFLPYAETAGIWQDNDCSDTRVYDADTANLRPANAVRVLPTARSAGQPVALAIGAAAAAAGIALLILRRRSRRI